MDQKKNYSGLLIGLLIGVIIIILIVLCILFATDVIVLNNDNYVRTEEKSSNGKDKDYNDKDEDKEYKDKEDNKKDKEENKDDEDGIGFDTSKFKEIRADDIKAESRSETIVVMITRQGCGYSAQFAPIITEVGKDYGIVIRYIDITEMSTSDYEVIRSLSGSGSWKTFAADNFGYTPETLIIQNNKVVGGIVGAVDKKTTEQIFEDAGLRLNPEEI